jgi:hypothetical protein
MARVRYKESVFINVPFDYAYKPIFDALVFTVHDCGFIARSALERDDGSQVRIEKICQLIAESKYGIHDISCTDLDAKYHLPRFNMPLELGIFLGAKNCGHSQHQKKIALILDEDRYRYQKFCSDIAGQDIKSHGGDVKKAIQCVRNWLRNCPDAAGVTLPGGSFIYRRYRSFLKQLANQCKLLKLDINDLQFSEYVTLVVGWLKKNP